jgi:hypothetical protein
MEREGQNFQPKKVQRLEEKKKHVFTSLSLSTTEFLYE